MVQTLRCHGQTTTKVYSKNGFVSNTESAEPGRYAHQHDGEDAATKKVVTIAYWRHRCNPTIASFGTLGKTAPEKDGCTLPVGYGIGDVIDIAQSHMEGWYYRGTTDVTLGHAPQHRGEIAEETAKQVWYNTGAVMRSHVTQVSSARLS